MMLQCIRFNCVFASVKTAFAFLRIALQYLRFTRVSASVKTAFAFSSYSVTMHAFHTRV